MATDRLLFLDRDGVRFAQALWTGPWPPPETLIYMEGKSGYQSIVDPDSCPKDALREARALGTISERRFKLRNCSSIDHAAPEGAHWFRGAEYVEVVRFDHPAQWRLPWAQGVRVG